MSRRVTRRRALTTVAGVAGSLTVAGCMGSDERRYWDAPPSFDDGGIESVTDRSVPDRPAVIPVAVADEQLEAFAARVDGLLEAIPEPLTAETLPNGEIREGIESEREAARDAVARMENAPLTLDAATAAADACERAGTAAGVWAAVSTSRSLEDVTLSESDLRGEMTRLADDLPDDAPDPLEGSGVYGPIESWLDTARRRTLTGRSGVGERADPLGEGTAIGEIERIRAAVDAGEHIRGRYVESIDQPRAIEDDLAAALETLAPRVENRLLAFHGDEDVEWPRTAPSLGAILVRDPPRDEPGVRLLSSATYEFFEELRFEPVAWPERTAAHPAHTSRTTYWALAGLAALERIRDRVEDGDDLFPADAETVREHREAAIDAVDDLVASDAPLERWLAHRLVPRFDEPDETVAPSADPDRRAVADANGEYVWIETMARAGAEASALVDDALP